MYKIYLLLILCLNNLLLSVGETAALSPAWWPSGEITVLQKMFDDCAKNSNDPAYCLKNKAATAVERALSRNISITEDLVLVQNNVHEARSFNTRNNQNLDPDQRIVQALQNLLVTHTFKVDLTDDSDTMVEEGRDKKEHEKKKKAKKAKKVLPYLLLLKLTAMSIFGPIAIKTLTLIAGNALIASKIALVISGMILLKKVFQSDSHHESATFQVHTVPEHHHRRDFRSFSLDNDVDPYRSYQRSQ